MEEQGIIFVNPKEGGGRLYVKSKILKKAGIDKTTKVTLKPNGSATFKVIVRGAV